LLGLSAVTPGGTLLFWFCPLSEVAAGSAGAGVAGVAVVAGAAESGVVVVVLDEVVDDVAGALSQPPSASVVATMAPATKSRFMMCSL
jgi:hypothetical protein